MGITKTYKKPFYFWLVFTLYKKLANPDRKILNQALFTHLEVTEDNQVRGKLASPFDVLSGPSSDAPRLTKNALVPRA